MNSDPQGKLGQLQFDQICTAVGLTCNRVDWDRTGWDFIVEFPFESGRTTAVETRQTPLSCHVQVKTLLEKNDRFKMRLSSAERLAKELKPAFVYVFKINETSEFTSAYLVHILGEALEKILKRLRQADAVGRQAVNKATISMSARADGTQIAATGLALREALETAVGNDLHAYAEKKHEQLATLGFEERPYSGKMTLHFSNREEILDVFLGIKKDVPVSDIYAEHTRFGITRPLPDLSGQRGTISIEPGSVDTCTIMLRGSPTSAPVVFKGKVFIPPPIVSAPLGFRKILLVADLFSMTLTTTGSRIRLSIESGNVDPLQTPTVWAEYWRFMGTLAAGKSILKITSDKHPVDLHFDIPGKVIQADPEECRHWLLLCEQLSFLYRFAGVADEPVLTMKSIAGSADKIAALHNLIQPETGTVELSFSLTVEQQEASVISSSFDVIQADFLALGEITIGYCVLAHMIRIPNEVRVEWKSENVALVGVTQLRMVPQQYEDMIANAVKMSGCQNVVRVELTGDTKVGSI